ncbi:DUF3575 domain-containing protein [Cellulophaga lytica]|uniref:DUF3575 domain-containing protein n=1 Tax=Cellulophaga lytica TaxID=979 RepID=UPI0026E257DB|nr:DUF3575 domain-containing protein [Cellulophaga lytica]MDO6854669.1 DUF3575 domain-containing protein [Cellulophaga lytica]
MKKQILLLTMFLSVTCFTYAQELESTDQTNNAEQSVLEYQDKKNIAKLSLTSLVFRNFQFQYERVLNKTFSVALSYGTIPEGGIPFGSSFVDEDEDDDLSNIVNDGKMSYSSFTPEVRIYTGKKGYGKGFYLAPFFRASKYTFKNVNFSFDADGGGTETLTTSGTVKGNTFGLLFGSQFNLGSNLVLDWWIAGPHIGSSNGNLKGVSSRELSQNEQDALLETLQDTDIPLVDTEYKVDANGAEIDLDGPWAGVRAGLSIGYRF